MDAVLAQDLVELAERIPAGLIVLAGIEPERALHLEIAEGAPAGIGPRIMRVQRHQRVRPVVVDAAKWPASSRSNIMTR